MTFRNSLCAGLTLVAAMAHAQSACAASAAEVAALQKLYTSTNGPGWLVQAGWSANVASEACKWQGVTCSGANADGSVIAVQLPGNRLSGKLPDLTELTSVTYFDFDDNQIGGSLPASFGNMRALVTWTSRNNNLTGSIPPLDNLPNLQELTLAGNLLSGSIPSLANLKALAVIDVSLNFLSGDLPPLTGLTTLVGIDVEHNNLSGRLPSLAGLTALNSFYVGWNHFNGVVPAVPAPSNNLLDSASSLCPNLLTKTIDHGWDLATGSMPWFDDVLSPGQVCDALIFRDDFEERRAPQ